MSVPSSQVLEQKQLCDQTLLYRDGPRVINIKAALGLKIERELLNACRLGEVERVKALLEKHTIDVNATFSTGSTPLIIAARYGNKSVVDFLLKQPGIDVKIYYSFGKPGQLGLTALLAAFEYWRSCKAEKHPNTANGEAVIEALMKAGADVNQVVEGSCFLLYELRNENEEAAKDLVTLGASISQAKNLFGSDRTLGNENTDNQLARLAELKKKLKKCRLEAAYLGIHTAGVCFQFMNKKIGLEISEFLFKSSSLEIRSFQERYEKAFRLLSQQHPAPAPKTLLSIPRSLFFMNELALQLHEQEYNRRFPKRAGLGYGAGAVVIYNDKLPPNKSG